MLSKKDKGIFLYYTLIINRLYHCFLLLLIEFLNNLTITHYLRLTNLTKTADEALSRPRIVQKEVQPEHLQKAKETFHMLKTELHGLIQSLFPTWCESIMDVMGVSLFCIT